MSKTQTKEQQIKARGTQYLNDYYNLADTSTKSVGELEANFKYDIQDIELDEGVDGRLNSSLIIMKYHGIVELINNSIAYRDASVRHFEAQALQLNSIISNSLLIEQQIHDILYNKDLVLMQKLEMATHGNIKYHDELKDINYLKGISKNLDQVKEKMRQSLKDDKELDGLVTAITDIQTDVDRAINVLKEQNKLDQNKIKELQKSSYHIKALSHNKGLTTLITSFLAVFLEVELLEALKQDLLKKHSIKITTKKPLFTYHEKKPTEITPYIILIHHLVELMDKSLLDNGKNVILDSTLKSFTLITNLEDTASTQQHQKVVKKYAKAFLQEIDDTHSQEKSFNMRVRTSYYADRILDELRWQSIEE